MHERERKAAEKDNVCLRDFCTQTPLQVVPPLPVLYTPNSTSQENKNGLLWWCRANANSILPAAGKAKLKHEQGSNHRCLGEEATAAHSSCSSASCSPGALVKTRPKGGVQGGVFIFWSPQREARPSSLSCWASWGKLDTGPRVH